MIQKGIKKHWEVFKAWLNGAEIEFKGLSSGKWVLDENPTWSLGLEYRVKPFEPKQGEKILVSETGEKWYDRIFIEKNEKNGRFVCLYVSSIVPEVVVLTRTSQSATLLTTQWKYAKPLTNNNDV